jgi:DNA-binding MarR family transcriptional regulator
VTEGLKGSLTQLPLIQVLHLLNSNGRTGRIALNDGSRSASVYLRLGSVVHAECGDERGLDAAYTLLNWIQGDFTFVPDVDAPEESITVSTDQLLEEAAAGVEEWEVIRDLIPSTDIVFSLSAARPPGPIALQPDEWQVLVHVDGFQSVGEIIARLGWEQFTVAGVLYRLATAGLIEVGEKTRAAEQTAGAGQLLDRLDEEFITVLGPLGPEIVSEEIAALGESREAFPRSKMAELVERVGAQISDQRRRSRFQEIMVDVLSSS